MSGFKIDITGDIKGIIKNKTKRLMDDIRDEISAFGEETVNDAKRLAPVDEGHLRNSIAAVYSVGQKGFEVEIVVATDYAAYIEFGTKGFAQKYVATLPTEWQQFAAKYKGGGGGSFDELVMRLTRWVRMKGIGATYNVQTRKRDRIGKQSAKTTMEADAYAIALHIVRHGVRQHPFLYPAVEKNRIKLLNNLKALK